MGNGQGDGDDDSEHSSDISGDSDGMDDEEHDEGDEDHDEDSIIDMLEEQQMEAEQVEGADGWTTDSDSAEEGEEMEEEEDESDGEEFRVFPGHGHIPVFDPDAGEVAYTEDDGDDGVEEFRDAVEGGLEHMLEALEDDDDDDEDEDDHLDYSWIDEEHMRRHYRVGGDISLALVLSC